MTEDVRPPKWAEALLRRLLPPAHRESVSGDLLEEYRESVFPTRGRVAADRWYMREVAGFLTRAAGVWGVVLAGAALGREALDVWLSPTQDFYVRSMVSTMVGAAIFATAGLWSAWRSRSVAAGVLAGVATGVIAALIINVVSAADLAMWHDAHTMAMIRAAGGVDEIFLLPVMVIVPGTMFALAGGLVGKLAGSVLDHARATRSPSSRS